MKVFLDPRQSAHHPRHWMNNGRVEQSPEVPERVEILSAAARSAGLAFETPGDAGLGPIAAIHTAEYLDFLAGIYARWSALENAAPEVVPKVHPANRTDGYPSNPVGQAGWHQADTSCPISADTWNSAYWSAQTAISGADALLAGERVVYSLSRPPGHHAFADLAGGFCYLNNSAIAAERLRAAGLRPAILDVDVHHGNGTQGIFYDRADILTVSIHADPDDFYPFFWGYAQERGAGPGLGANLNLPLPRRSGDEVFMEALSVALRRIEMFGADVIVVALGLDAYEGDPFKGLAVTTDGFARIGKAIAGAGRPLLLVQEGGYVSEALGTNLVSFLSGLDEGRH